MEQKPQVASGRKETLLTVGVERDPMQVGEVKRKSSLTLVEIIMGSDY